MNTKKLTIGLVAVASLGVFVLALWFSGSDGLASLAGTGNPSKRVYVTKGVKLTDNKGYVQVTLEIHKKKGVTTISEKVNSAPKKVGQEE